MKFRRGVKRLIHLRRSYQDVRETWCKAELVSNPRETFVSSYERVNCADCMQNYTDAIAGCFVPFAADVPKR